MEYFSFQNIKRKNLLFLGRHIRATFCVPLLC